METVCNTLPAPTNINRTEHYIEAMTLAGIVEEVMKNDPDTVVTYSNDGPSLSGTGNFIIQSFVINGVRRALPTLGIFTGSRETLVELELMTLKILYASTGNKYSPKEIMEKIDFVMTDSTSHNINVVDQVCENLNCDKTSKFIGLQHPSSDDVPEKS